MKKVLYGLILAALAIAGVAQANQVLRQNPDGTADWVGSDSRNTSPVGAAFLQLYLTSQLGTVASTTYQLVSPISNAVIKDVRVNKQGAGGGTATYTITVNNGLSSNTLMTPMSQMGTTGGPTYALILVGSSATTSNYALTPISTITGGRFLNNSVQQGDLILVNVAGATTASTQMLIITVVPK